MIFQDFISFQSANFTLLRQFVIIINLLHFRGNLLLKSVSMFKFNQVNNRLKITKFTSLVLLLALDQCQSVRLQQGQDIHFDFPYPCDSTKVTLRQGYKPPFFTLMKGEIFHSLLDYQEDRFKVHIKDGGTKCSLHLKIRNVTRSDAGTYISTVYRDGQLTVDLTSRFGLQIDYPPGKALCSVGGRKGADWVSLDCEADSGSIAGQIICYQNTEKMPTLNGPTETYTTLRETILIRETEPAFCCSSCRGEHKGPCECKDTVYQTENSRNEVYEPCLTKAVTTTSSLNQITETEQNKASQYYHFPNTESHQTPPKMECNNNTAVIIHSIIVPLEVLLLLLTASIIIYYKTRLHSQTDCQPAKKPTNSSNSVKQVV